MGRERRLLWLILAVALALRLGVTLGRDPLAPYTDRSGDTGWYLAQGYTLITGAQPPAERGVTVNLASLGVPPVYLAFIGVPQALFAPAAATRLIWVAQALLGTLTCWLVWRLARRLAGERAGLAAAALLAISPAFIIESGQIVTETIYIFLVAAALDVYTRAIAPAPFHLPPSPLAGSQPDDRRLQLAWLVASAVLLGLATLTRAVLLLFPVGLALHLVMVYGWRGSGRAALLVLVYAAVVGAWTVYNLAAYNRLIIAGEGFAANLYLGATGWTGGDSVDERLTASAGALPDDESAAQSVYADAAASSIRANPVGYLARRTGELLGAYIQPHNTTAFPGASLRALAAAWWRDDRSAGGLAALTREDGFWHKLALYVFHFGTLALALVGVWQTRQRWRLTLPLLGFIAYTTLIHLFLLALPRYLFPTFIGWTVFAGAALASAALRSTDSR